MIVTCCLSRQASNPSSTVIPSSSATYRTYHLPGWVGHTSLFSQLSPRPDTDCPCPGCPSSPLLPALWLAMHAFARTDRTRQTWPASCTTARPAAGLCGGNSGRWRQNRQTGQQLVYFVAFRHHQLHSLLSSLSVMEAINFLYVWCILLWSVFFR